MKKFTYSALCVVSLSALLALNTSCGMSKKKMQEAETRIKALESKGVPDSIMADVKVQLYNITTAKKVGNGAGEKKATDSMYACLTSAEEWYKKALAEYKPAVQSLVSKINGQKSELAGLQLRVADSLLSIVDSFSKMEWVLQAKQNAEKLDSLMPTLLKNQETVNKLKVEIVGKWNYSHTVKAEEGNFSYLEKRSINFKNDGTFEKNEERKGQSTPFMKEDWQFLSWGTYDFKGDTIQMYVTREKCPRQIFTTLNVKDNKWTKKESPTYDSTYTNHSKDMTMAYSDLKLDFKKTK